MDMETVTIDLAASDMALANLGAEAQRLLDCGMPAYDLVTGCAALLALLEAEAYGHSAPGVMQ